VARAARLRAYDAVYAALALDRSAALFTLVSVYGFTGVYDPARVAAQIVTGIGFLGAGAILHQRRSVQGLTTAASLWVAAAIGMAVGVGMLGDVRRDRGAGVLAAAFRAPAAGEGRQPGSGVAQRAFEMSADRLG
jgi:hypothetical protein